jgi:MFS family permease
VPRARTSIAVPLFAVAFGTNVATPLLLLYESRLGLSTWTLTALFAIYPLGLTPALVFSGPASDVLGRRRVMIPGVVLSGLASVVLMAGADAVWMLYLGRFLLGVVSGLVLVVASAWMQEVGGDDPLWTSRMLGLIMYVGFGLGPLVSGLVGQWGPAPLVVPYALHLVMVVAGLWCVRSAPETVRRDPTRRIRPNLGVPAEASRQFWTVVVPTAFGVFGMPSLALGLFPVLLKPAMPGIAVLVSGMIGFLAMGSIIPAQAWVGRVGPHRSAPVALACGTVGTLLGLTAFATGWWPLLLPASLAVGAASGLAMTSGLRFVDLICRPEDRGALNGSFYAVAYMGMMMPLVVSSIGRVVGSLTPVLAIVAMVTAALTLWLRHATTIVLAPAGRSV